MTFALNAEVRGTSNLIRDKVLTMNPENAMTLTLYTSNMTVEDESVELSAMLQVYPNPAADYVVVNCLDGIPSAVTIFDALGRPVLHSYPQTERFELELEYLKSGQYTLVIDASNKRYVRKLVIE